MKYYQCLECGRISTLYYCICCMEKKRKFDFSEKLSGELTPEGKKALAELSKLIKTQELTEPTEELIEILKTLIK